MRKAVITLILALAAGSWPGPAAAAKILFKFNDWAGPTLRVFATRPVGLAADRPVVFVMHGSARNAEGSRDQWHELAVANDFLLLVPEFSERDFRGAESYEFGNVRDAGGGIRPEAEWAFFAIEKIFDEARRRFSIDTKAYAIYGRAAGAQFAHRFLYFVSDARLTRVVAADAGWYTMPEFAVDFPYGLRGSGIDEAALSAALGRPLTILLGQAAIEPGHSGQHLAPGALAQGSDRFERGQAFIQAAARHAEELGVPVNWQMVTVPDATTDLHPMPSAALPYLLKTD